MLCLFAALPNLSSSFAPFHLSKSSIPIDTWQPRTILHLDPKWEQEIEENSRRKASQKGPGVGETAAGAILGGLLLGPFGKEI